MPHLTIEYSANMEERINIAELCDCLRIAMLETGVFPLKGIRVRALRATHVSIADGDPRHGFVDISLRLREGRDLETRKQATAHVFAAAEKFLNPSMEKDPIALSFEMRNIDPELSPKVGSIAKFLDRPQN